MHVHVLTNLLYCNLIYVWKSYDSCGSSIRDQEATLSNKNNLQVVFVSCDLNGKLFRWLKISFWATEIRDQKITQPNLSPISGTGCSGKGQ